jgi:hypothetical protein
LIALVALGRTGAGITAFAQPESVARLTGADRGTASRAGVFVRLFAARELALGLGTLNAIRAGHDVRPWVIASALGDAGDAVAFAIATRSRTVGAVRGLAIAASAVGGVAAAVIALRTLRN